MGTAFGSLAGSAPSNIVSHSRIAIVGGGISGLSAAYELARRAVPFEIFEASGRFGGIIETARHGDFVIECGPDSWVTEKPWARELAAELGLDSQILSSNDRIRRTYLARPTHAGSKLVPIPDGMRMMVPERWGPLLRSSIFGWGIEGWRTKFEYLREPYRAEELKEAASKGMADESIAEFVRRHFGEQVATTLAAPLLAGVFGGDTRQLSTRAVLPAFAKMEKEYGSLVAGLRSSRRAGSSAPLFSTLASGLEALVEALVRTLPADSLQLQSPVSGLAFEDGCWKLLTNSGERRFRGLILATPGHVTRGLLRPLGDTGRQMAALIPEQATSAIVVAFCFEARRASSLRIPRGFGILFPASGERVEPGLSACTFVDQKFPRRAPEGAVLLRAFFGGSSAETLLSETDGALIDRARGELARVLETGEDGMLPAPDFALVRRWPRSLPQYWVGHTGRVSELDALMKRWSRLELIGNTYHGVGISDLIREGRAAAMRMAHGEA